MEREHRNAIQECKQIERLRRSSDRAFLFWRFADDLAMLRDILNNPPGLVSRLAREYRVRLDPVYHEQMRKRKECVSAWFCQRRIWGIAGRRYANCRLSTLTLIFLLIVVGGFRRCNSFWEWDPERMMENMYMPLTVVFILAVVTLAVRPALKSVTGRKLSFSVLFSILLSIFLILSMGRFLY